MRKHTLPILLFIFVVSGFSGLIYESIWTHYLKLFLGHAAYAQSLVLATFMGGLAIGSWLASRYSQRWPNLLQKYALAEALIGLSALLFHSVFDLSIRFSLTSVLPNLGSPAVAYAFKWLLSVLLILPQSILLGMTFPLMTAGILRLAPKNPGRTIALLYFTNSLGAAIGVLASGFVLIRLLGLPWTIRVAGLLNLALAFAVLYLAGERGEAPPLREHAEGSNPDASRRGRYRTLLLVALVTGTSSFLYEIGWIRMLSLVIGSSTHAFELMLSAFILGLALGGLWIQRLVDRIEQPERYLAFVQVAMGLLALSTLVLYGGTFGAMKWLLQNIDKTADGYLAFNLASNGIALAIMLPTTFCAGMTLPLITAILLRRNGGEQTIGAVYGANTVGAILGVFFAIHVGMPAFGLKGLITFGAGCDIALGLLLLFLYARPARRQLAITAAVGAGAIAAVLLGVTFDPYQLASGVYRTGMFLYPQLTEITSHTDGKTATISTYLEKATGVVAVATNGKSDAAVGMNLAEPATPDESTMVLLGALTMAFNPAAHTAANIGLGSGLTTQVLLGNPVLTQVDTVEIEPAVVEAGAFFLPRVPRVYQDPRSHIHIDDAKTYFSTHRKKYDLIVSEPSNPWVSGVASLFSEEFYELAGQHLAPGGVFAQWVQLYEIDSDLVLSILKALSSQFSDFAIYSTNDRDMMIVARKDGAIGQPHPGIFTLPEVAAALDRVGVHSAQDFELRKIGSKRLLGRLLASSAIQANSDYLPIVDQNAARTRFMEANAYDLPNLFQGLGPLLELLSEEASTSAFTQVTASPHLARSQAARRAMALRDLCLLGGGDPRDPAYPPDLRQAAIQLVQAFQPIPAGQDPAARQASLYNGLTRLVPYLRPQELEAVWARLDSGPGAASLPPLERAWVDLFKALGRRDPKALATHVQTVLQTPQRLPREVLQFLVASGMAANLAMGDRPTANRLWVTGRTVLFPDGEPDLLFRLLVAESLAPR
ncbi:MAG: fused MFS/spermidine synthase [Holophagaceae bacterium]